MHVLFNSTCTDGRRFVVFFVGAALGRNNMVNCRVFFVEPPSTCQSESFKDAEWHVEGGGMSLHASEQAATQGGCYAALLVHSIIKNIKHSTPK